MGVSLHTYRVRIGTFYPVVRVKATKEQAGTFKTSFKWNYLIIVAMLLSFLTCSIALPHNYATQSGAFRSPWNLPPRQPPWFHPTCQPQTPPWTFPAVSDSVSVQATDKWPFSKKLINRKSHREHNKLVRAVNGNRGQGGHGIKLAHWNKGPSYLPNSQQDIQTVIAQHKPHLLGISEANLKKTHDLALVQHSDYQLHTCATMDNPSLGISRVVTYTHKSLIVKKRPDLDDASISAIWMEVGLPRHRKIIICQAYREWGYLGQGRDNTSGTLQAQLGRWITFLDKWELALQEDKEVIVMMDANLDFLKWTQTNLQASDHTARLNPLVQQLFTRIFPLGVSQLVSTATRFWPGQEESGLDHLYSNKPDKLSRVEAEFIGLSDHKLIKVTRYSKSLQRNVRYVRKRSFKNFNPKEFCQAVQDLSWWEVYMSDDPNQAASLLTDKLTAILDRLAPVKTFQVRNNYAPWLSKESKKLIEERNNAQKLAAETKKPDDWNKYKNLRNTVKNKLRIEKRKWEEFKLNSTEHNPSTIWKNVKGWLNWKNTGPPSQLFHQGKIINSPAQLASTMNNFFLDKVKLLRGEIPDNNTDPLAKLRESMERRDCSMKFRPVKPEEVLKIIRGLKNSKSTGIDDINTTVLKLVAKDILPAVTHIVNQSLSQSVFPTIWKHSKVIPLLKTTAL